MTTTYPLATLAAQVSVTGIAAPSYADILASLQASYQAIYGSDAVLTPDSQDGQLLAVFAQAINDCNQTAIAVYNAFSPTYAQGAGLSSLVKINGIRREVPTYSTVSLTITGQANTVITNGVAQDTLGNKWNLPPSVTIPSGGSIIVTATCAVAGAIGASIGTVTQIATPTLGWQSVTNATAAVLGNPVESDAALRKRQTVSTSLPAQTPLQAIIANVANVTGVGRYAVYENPTSATDANGLPPHSIAVVAEGGDPAAITAIIETKKSPGTDTYGTTSVIVTDPAGVAINISYFQLTEVPVYALVGIKTLTGYVSSTATSIATAVAAFVEALNIGTNAYLNKAYAPANLSGDVPVSATGLTQAQLDALANTYNVKSLYLARSDMTVTGGPYAAGATAVSVSNVANFSAGSAIILIASDGSQIAATVASVVGSTVNFTPALPAGKTVNNNSLVYVAGDLAIAFNAAASCSAGNITVTTQ